MIETPSERASMFVGWGSATVVGSGAVIAGHYDDPSAEDLGMDGTEPSFRATRDALATAAVGLGTALDIVSHTGRAVGRHRVTIVREEDDGEIVTLRLSKVEAVTGVYLLEDGSGGYLLEDGSGRLALE